MKWVSILVSVFAAFSTLNTFAVENNEVDIANSTSAVQETKPAESNKKDNISKPTKKQEKKKKKKVIKKENSQVKKNREHNEDVEERVIKRDRTENIDNNNGRSNKAIRANSNIIRQAEANDENNNREYSNFDDEIDKENKKEEKSKEVHKNEEQQPPSPDIEDESKLPDDIKLPEMTNGISSVAQQKDEKNSGNGIMSVLSIGFILFGIILFSFVLIRNRMYNKETQFKRKYAKKSI